MRGEKKKDKKLQAVDSWTEQARLEEMYDQTQSYHGIQKKEGVELSLSEWLVRNLDFEAMRVGVNREDLIKQWIVQKLDSERANRGVYSLL
tara:strand:+ start:787 stop:1059 length:273 start_codon:yes stop_codon:yes gene_type:complete